VFYISVLCVISVRSGSHVSGSGSVKSDHSKGDGPNFREEKTPEKRYFICFALHQLIFSLW